MMRAAEGAAAFLKWFPLLPSSTDRRFGVLRFPPSALENKDTGMIVRFDDITHLSDGFSLALDQLPATLGRDKNATIRLTNALTSRHHCEIDIQHNQLVVRDLGSMNGTFLNGHAVKEAPIVAGDTLLVGLQSFLVGNIEVSGLQKSKVTVADDSLASAGV